MVVPAAFFCWLAFWHNVTRDHLFTVHARWEPVTLARVTSGRHLMKFTALDSSMTLTVASDDLYDELEAARKESVDVLVRETFKHGELVTWSVESIDGTHDFSMLERDRR
jgi:hypothetical protein